MLFVFLFHFPMFGFLVNYRLIIVLNKRFLLRAPLIMWQWATVRSKFEVENRPLYKDPDTLYKTYANVAVTTLKGTRPIRQILLNHSWR